MIRWAAAPGGAGLPAVGPAEAGFLLRAAVGGPLPVSD